MKEATIALNRNKEEAVIKRDRSDAILFLNKEDNASFEKRRTFWWCAWDCTFGFVLALWIFIKSMAKIWSSIPLRKAIRIFFNSKERRKFVRRERSRLRGMKTVFFNRNSPLLQHFCKNVTSAAALDDVYNSNMNFRWPRGEALVPLSTEIDPVGQFYLNCPNGQAVRNRCRGVMDQFESALEEVLSRKGEAKVLSVACGSAQAVIHKTSLMMDEGLDKKKVSFTLTDADEEPLSLAKTRAEQAGILDRVNLVQTHFKDLQKTLEGEKYDIIEACGIADYLPENLLLLLFGLVNSLLEDRGHFITSNMRKTRGSLFLTWTYNWPILYRSPEELHTILKNSNFQSPKVFVEPWGIHMYATARK